MGDQAFVVFVVFWLVGSIIVGMTGMNKRIGFGRAFGVSLFFSPFIGIIVAMLSKDLDDINDIAEIKHLLKQREEI